jgi:hypothetical protein
MGKVITNEQKIKRLEEQIKKHSNNAKMVSNFKGRIACIQGKQKK